MRSVMRARRTGLVAQAQGHAHAHALRVFACASAVACLTVASASADTARAIATHSESTGGPIVLPSGTRAQLHEVLTDASSGGVVLRFRYVADGFDPQTVSQDDLTIDLHHLCVAQALAHVRSMGIIPGQVVISLADKPGQFGVADPDIRQVFEAFTIHEDRCIWEMF